MTNNKLDPVHATRSWTRIHCPQNREEQSGGEGEARASATAGAAAARSAARSARIRWFRVCDSPCTCHGSGSPGGDHSQRLQHQRYPGNPDAPSGSERQQHQEETHRRRWVIEFFDVDDPSTCDYSRYKHLQKIQDRSRHIVCERLNVWRTDRHWLIWQIIRTWINEERIGVNLTNY